MHVQSRSGSVRRGTLAAVAAVGILAAGCTGAAPPAATPAATPVLAANVAPVSTPAPTAKPTPAPTAAIVVVTPVPGAEDSKVVDQLSSLDAKWSKTVLTAPAGKAWHVAVNATDPLGKHNFTITSGPAVEQRIFQSPTFGVGVHTFDLPALPAGTYTFICTIHPDTMHGTVEVS